MIDKFFSFSVTYDVASAQLFIADIRGGFVIP
jgi:hypothetical protein